MKLSKKMLVLLLTMFFVFSINIPFSTIAASTEKYIIGGVYGPDEDFGHTNNTESVSQYATVAFYPANGTYGVGYYNHPLVVPLGTPQDIYPYYFYDPLWNISGAYETTGPGVEYIVVGESEHNGVNYTGSTNMSITTDTRDYFPNIYLEQIPTPYLNSQNNISGMVNITWDGLYENISDNCLDGTQTWKNYTNNIKNYTVYRDSGGGFQKVGSIGQKRGETIYYEEALPPGNYLYRLGVTYKSGVYETNGYSNISEAVTIPDYTHPSIINLIPSDGCTVIENHTTISAEYSDESGVNTSSVRLEIDSIDVTDDTVVTENNISYNVTDLGDKEHQVYLYLEDINGNEYSQYWWFSVDTTPPAVFSISPQNNSLTVGVTDPVIITFNEKMSPDTVEEATIIIPNNVGVWSWSWLNEYTARGIHSLPFLVNTTYAITINDTAEDKHGNRITYPYSSAFTTVSGVSVTIISPIGGSRLTGNITHPLEYQIAGGQAPYQIDFGYTTDQETYHHIDSISKNQGGTFTINWTPPNINSDTVALKIVANDSIPTTDFDITGTFMIDSTPPTILSITPENSTKVLAEEHINIKFNETMNTTSVENSIMVTPDPGGWNWTWSENNTRIIGIHNIFQTGITYTVIINMSAKDCSIPGNNINQTYTWNFTVVKGRGDINIIIEYPDNVEQGKEYSIKITAKNNGPHSEKVSGSLTIIVYKIVDGKATYVDTGYITSIQKNGTGIFITRVMFDKSGTQQQIRVEVVSTHPDDLLNNQKGSVTIIRNINVASESLGVGPYILIVLIPVISALIAALVIWSRRKKKKGGSYV